MLSALSVCLTGLARRVNAKILIASTSEIYGDPEVHPQSETYWGHVNPIGTPPLNDYLDIYFFRFTNQIYFFNLLNNLNYVNMCQIL